MQSHNFSYSQMLFAAFLVAMVTRIAADCQPEPSWSKPVCAARRGEDGVLKNATCWEPTGYSSLFCDYANARDVPRRDIYDLSYCEKKSCTANADCGTSGTCTAGKCVVTNDNYLLGAKCEYNCDCVGTQICCFDDCLEESICKPRLSCKAKALCEVTYTDSGPTENRDCWPGTACVSFPVGETSDEDVDTIKRCDFISCTTNADCLVGVCAGPPTAKVCDPDPLDPQYGKLALFFASECNDHDDCIGDQKCCKDIDLFDYDKPTMCMSEADCERDECHDDD